MTFSQAKDAIQVGQRIPYARADGSLTNRGFMEILNIKPDCIVIRPHKGKDRRIRENDWQSVESGLPQLRNSGSFRQDMTQTRNVTYVLSLMAAVG